MVALLFLGTATKAEDFSAIVEEASPGAPVQVFSYLPDGHVALGKTLSPGGSYRVDTGADSIVARVDRNARSGDEQILPRLLSF